jgi:hypothetical protein
MFKDLSTVFEAQKVLFDGTYWFGRLMLPDGKHGQIAHGRNGVAILRLLGGLSTFAGKERVDQLVKLRLKEASVKKLQNLLETVNGVLMQLTLGFPLDKEIQSWSFMDRIANSLICLLLPDYFSKDPERSTAFEKLKSIRKDIKMFGFNQAADFEEVNVPQEFSWFRSILNRMGKRPCPWRGFLTMVLSQTRASGVPPLPVYMKTMQKIHSLLQEPADISVYRKVRPFIKPAIEHLFQDVNMRFDSLGMRDSFYTRCVSAAKISLSDSGEFFTKAEDGGKLEAARKVLQGRKSVDEIDLVTGIKTGKQVTSPGEMLFHWACFEFSHRENIYDRNLMSVRISLVAELGKYRAITVSHLAHAVLLHVLSHVLLEFLKGVPSSASGVGAANHAWNFFERITGTGETSFLNVSENYFYSSDLSQATDYSDHYVAAALLNALCRCMGVPEWYRQTCVFALTAPRQVETIDPENKTLEVFYSSRGVLMGDPVTKVVLHLFHLVTKYALKALIHEIDLMNRNP